MSWPPCNICKAQRRNLGNARHGAIWNCRKMAHHAWKCPLPEDWKKFWSKFYLTKTWELEGFAKMLAKQRKRYLK
jgi:hypothetical protein